MSEFLERYTGIRDLIDLIKQVLSIALPKNSRLPPEQEFNKLLSKRLFIPHRLVQLALTLIDNGKPLLAERAIQKLRSDFSLLQSAPLSAGILFFLDKDDQIDALYEGAAASVGGREHIDPRIKSQWATYISLSNFEKAIHLSKEAVDAAPSENAIIEAHLGIQSLRAPDAALKFFQEHRSAIQSDSGLLLAGQAFLKTGCSQKQKNSLGQQL